MFGKLEDIEIFSDEYPVMILQLWYTCNINCRCCYNNYLKKLDKKEKLDPQILEKIIIYCSNNNISLYTGVGEPFLYWNYIENVLLPLLKKYQVKCLFSSNGYWGENDELLNKVKYSSIEYLTLSIDYAHKEWIKEETTNNIIKQLKDSNIKLYVSTIWSDSHPKTEIILPYNDKINRIWYEENKDQQHKLYFHDFKGNIFYGHDSRKN